MLGGTEFVGGAVTEDALARGWDVTVFNRGRHEPPKGVASLQGDRTAEGGLKTLEDGEWDAVVDTWSGAPSAVRDAARLLGGRVGHYVYISSRSVYRFPTPFGLGEEADVVDGSPDEGDVDYAAAKRGGSWRRSTCSETGRCSFGPVSSWGRTRTSDAFLVADAHRPRRPPSKV